MQATGNIRLFVFVVISFSTNAEMESLAIVLILAFVVTALEAAEILKVRDVTADCRKKDWATWTRSLSKDEWDAKNQAKIVEVANAAVEYVLVKA